jgi:hypothetical protein
LVKVPLSELNDWDAEHDVLGNKLAGLDESGNDSVERIEVTKKEA